MKPPGKARHIGGRYPGSEHFEDLVNGRYNLATLTGMSRERFLARASEWGSKAVYDRWLAAYRANDGSFLDHVAWGADRDLGDGNFLYGAMDDRFATNAHRVIAPDGIHPANISGKTVCVVGAWDGTECLLLHALGAARVDAIEEVPAFCAMTRLQLDAWTVPGEVYRRSLYEVDVAATWQRYELLYVPGVLYHLTDLPAALLILWSMLRPGGVLAFESVADPGAAVTARYLGPSTPGWNWWSPTPACYERLMRDCGFLAVRTHELSNGRGWWIGTRAAALPPALRGGAAGFSRPELLRQVIALEAAE